MMFLLENRNRSPWVLKSAGGGGLLLKGSRKYLRLIMDFLFLNFWEFVLGLSIHALKQPLH